MSKICRTVLCRRYTVATTLPLPHDPLRFKPNLLAPYRTFATPSNSKLVTPGQVQEFGNVISDFGRIRRSGMAYFDKTGYIPALEKEGNVQLVCRPRRFGKSLTVSMLQHFYGVQFRSRYDELFKGLDVDEAVQKGIVQPGRYLTLKFDFSRAPRSPDLNEVAAFLQREINYGLLDFKDDYAEALGKSFESRTSNFNENDPTGNLAHLISAANSALRRIRQKDEKDNPLWDVEGIYVLVDEYDAQANELMDPHDLKSWPNVEPFQMLKGVFAGIKAGMGLTYGIKRIYITGITPLLLSDLVSGANIINNISFNPQISTLCGLTKSDVLGALGVICNDEEEVQKHLHELESHANGYHFCETKSVNPVFNTSTALSYLHSVKRGHIFKLDDPPNSEVSEHFLRICAGAPAAVNSIQFALQRDEHGAFQRIPCQNVLRSFTLSELNPLVGEEDDMSAWQSLLVYMGGLTFDSTEPSKFLKIPNLVAAKRFGKALLDRLNLYKTTENAIHTLNRTGDPMEVLAGYCQAMRQRDIFGNAFKKTEEHHRDSIWITLLDNPVLQAKAEYEIRKTTDRPGFIDLRITNDKDLYTIVEFKNIQLRYLSLDGEEDTDRAKEVENMGLKEILNLKFEGDKYRSGTIQTWIDGKRGKTAGEVRKQLQAYIASPTVQKEMVGKNFRAFIAVIVGSRQILVREMDRRGAWIEGFQLCRTKTNKRTSIPQSASPQDDLQGVLSKTQE